MDKIDLGINEEIIERLDTITGRFYKTPAGIFPSITTVLSGSKDNTYLDAWRERVGVVKADKISKSATDSGTDMHTLFEHFVLEDLTPEEFSALLRSVKPKAQMFYKQLKPLLVRTISKYVGIEMQLYSSELGIAGSTDLVAILLSNNELAIVDYKGNNKLDTLKKEEYIEDYKIQISAYAKMFEHQYKIKIPYGVILMTNGLVNQKWIFETEEYIDKLKERISLYHKNLTNKL